MQAHFKVRNFGPIEDAELDLRNVNVLIGPQSSGKSILAKLYTICKSPYTFLKKEYIDYLNFLNFNNNLAPDLDVLQFEDALKEYNIHTFISSKSFIEYDSELHYFRYSNGKIVFKRKFENDITKLEQCCSNLENTQKEVQVILNKYSRSLDMIKALGLIGVFRKRFNKEYSQNWSEYLEFSSNFVVDDNFNDEELRDFISWIKYSEKRLLSSKALYIPAERIIISILRNSTWSLQSNEIPIPKHIINFGALFEKAASVVKELNLDFVSEGLKYKNVVGVDKVFISPRKSFLLTEAATGLQSIIPLLLPILADRKENFYSNPSYVIEEPELNLYPKAQYELMKFLESNRYDSKNMDSTYIHTYTTHSPYILASFNNMLYAYKVYTKYKNDEIKVQNIESILSKSNWLNPENFNAYVIKQGKAIQIFNREVGLIDNNEIDQVSDKMNDDFDRLLNI